MNQELKLFLKTKKSGGSDQVGGRVDVNQELKLFWKCKNKKSGGGGLVRSRGW